MNPWLSVERIDHQSGVFGDRVLPLIRDRREGIVVVERLETRVLLEGRAGLVRFRNGRQIPQGDHVERRGAEYPTDFRQLVAIGRGDQEAPDAGAIDAAAAAVLDGQLDEFTGSVVAAEVNEAAADASGSNWRCFNYQSSDGRIFVSATQAQMESVRV